MTNDSINILTHFWFKSMKFPNVLLKWYSDLLLLYVVIFEMRTWTSKWLRWRGDDLAVGHCVSEVFVQRSTTVTVELVLLLFNYYETYIFLTRKSSFFNWTYRLFQFCSINYQPTKQSIYRSKDFESVDKGERICRSLNQGLSEEVATWVLVRDQQHRQLLHSIP